MLVVDAVVLLGAASVVVTTVTSGATVVPEIVVPDPVLPARVAVDSTSSTDSVTTIEPEICVVIEVSMMMVSVVTSGGIMDGGMVDGGLVLPASVVV